MAVPGLSLSVAELFGPFRDSRGYYPRHAKPAPPLPPSVPLKAPDLLSPLSPPAPDAPRTFQAQLADSLASAGSVIARRWLDRVVALNAVDPNRVFPTR